MAAGWRRDGGTAGDAPIILTQSAEKTVYRKWGKRCKIEWQKRIHAAPRETSCDERAAQSGAAPTPSAKKLSATERESLIERMTAEMKAAAKALEFEKAAFLRDEIARIRSGK